MALFEKAGFVEIRHEVSSLEELNYYHPVQRFGKIRLAIAKNRKEEIRAEMVRFETFSLKIRKFFLVLTELVCIHHSGGLELNYLSH